MKSLFRLMVGIFIVTITIVACNSKKSSDKTDVMDSADTRPVKPIDRPAGTSDSTGKMDTADTRPVKPID